MTEAWRPAAFAVALAALLGAGLAAGSLVDPGAPRAAAPSGSGSGHGGEAAMAMAGEHGDAAGAPVRGLAIAAGGLRLQLATPELPLGRRATIAFRILDARGATLRAFDVEHTKRMHLILVRRDLTRFQHLHPVQQRDGSWRTTATVAAAGSYRLFADFSHDGAAQTLAADVRVDGPADLRALPAPDLPPARAGRETRLRFTPSGAGGRPVAVQPYLGAGGHLVALREGDLAFLHVHPTSPPGHTGPITFMTTFPTPGRYRLFLQYRSGGRVHTEAFTQEVTA